MRYMLPDQQYLLWLAGISIPAGGLFFWLRSVIKTNQLLIHAVIIFFLFVLGGTVQQLAPESLPHKYLLLQGVSLLIGIVHTVLLYRYVVWKQPEHITAELLFTIMLLLLGSVAFILNNILIPSEGIPWFMLTALLPFLFPFLMMKTISLWLEIPVPVYQVWQYIPALPVPEVAAGDSIRIHLLMSRTQDDNSPSQFTIRAPMNMKFEEVFHFFIHDYNQKHPEHPIVANTDDFGFAWYFYSQQSKWSRALSISPKISVYRNQLPDNAVIHAKRITLSHSS